MISYNNSAPNAVNNVGQFGATEGSIGAYKSAAEYAADSKYWAMLSQKNYNSIDEILKEVERLYAQGLLMESDIEQLKNDFEEQNQALLGLIQSTGTAIDNTNAATELSKEATREVLAQLDIISNMTVQTTLLPPGSMATGSYDNTTGVFSFGIPEGQPGRDGTDGTISDIGDVAIGVPVSDDYGFYVDKENGGLYRATMSDIANLMPSIRSISINGGEEQTGAVSFNSVSSFNSRIGDVVSEVGDYSVEQITGAAKSGANSDITSLSGLTTALSVSQGGTGASTPEASRTNLGLGSVSVEDIVPLIKGGTGATTPSAARTNLGLGLVSTESIVPITKGGTGSTSAENARLALVAAKSGANSDITSMTNSVTFTQPVSVADAVDATNAVNLGQISSDQGASLIGTLEGVPVQNIISNINTDIIQLKLNWAIENGYSDIGFTFTTGGTLTVNDRDKVVYDPVSKTWYSYAGVLPVTVPAGFNPVGNADWKPQTDPDLRAELASTSVDEGASLIGFSRKPIASAISSVQAMLDAQPVNVWEFVGDITVKPDPSDPSTWDWTPAFESAAAYISHSSLSPDVSGGCVFVPAVNKDMIYHITSVTIPIDCALVAYGATISPYDYSATETHLFKFMGMNKVAGLQIAMDYSLTYASAIWCRGRNIDFSECAVWFAANAITAGDPAWLSDPSQGYLGDSEISFSNCQFNWCLKTCTAYGINTIVAFVGGSRCYANRGSIPSSHPNAAAWASAPMSNFINYGAHIYIVGCFLSTFSRDIPTLTARVMPTNTTDYQNTYGRFIVEGTHIETSFLYYAPPESPAAVDVITKSLVVHNCQGHIATSPANNYWVTASDQMLQGIIISECGFYGTHGVTPTRTKLITAPSAPVFVGRESFNNVISGDFKDACNINYPMKTNGLTLVNAFGSAQSIGTSGSTLIMPANGSTSLINGSRGYYYSNSTGTFTAAVTLSNVSIIVDLRYSSPSSANTVTLDLVVAGAVVDSVVVTGGYPRGVLFAPTISKGANFTVRATGVGTYTLSGGNDCKIRLIANT